MSGLYDNTVSFSHARWRDQLLESTEISIPAGIKYTITQVDQRSFENFNPIDLPFAQLHTLVENTLRPIPKIVFILGSGQLFMMVHPEMGIYSFTAMKGMKILSEDSYRSIANTAELAKKMLLGEIPKQLTVKQGQCLCFEDVDASVLDGNTQSLMRLINEKISPPYKLKARSDHYRINFLVAQIPVIESHQASPSQPRTMLALKDVESDFIFELTEIPDDIVEVNFAEFARNAVDGENSGVLKIPPNHRLCFLDFPFQEFLDGPLEEVNQTQFKANSYDIFLRMISERVPETHTYSLSQRGQTRLRINVSDGGFTIALTSDEGITLRIVPKPKSYVAPTISMINALFGRYLLSAPQ